MATVTAGGSTTASKNASNHHTAGFTFQQQLEAENDVEKPIVYRSTKGADACFLRSPEPKYDNHGQFIGNDHGIRMEFTKGVSHPYYLSNPINKREVGEIDQLIKEGWPIVNDIGLEKVEAGAPLAPLVKWNEYGRDAIKIALEANFKPDDADYNVQVCEQGIRYELSRAKKDQRKEVLSLLEGMRLSERNEASTDDALNVTV